MLKPSIIDSEPESNKNLVSNNSRGQKSKFKLSYVVPPPKTSGEDLPCLVQLLTPPPFLGLMMRPSLLLCSHDLLPVYVIHSALSLMDTRCTRSKANLLLCDYILTNS